MATTIGLAGIGLGIASPYLLPAIIEKSLLNTNVQIGVSGGFHANFIKIHLSEEVNFVNN